MHIPALAVAVAVGYNIEQDMPVVEVVVVMEEQLAVGCMGSHKGIPHT